MAISDEEQKKLEEAKILAQKEGISIQDALLRIATQRKDIENEIFDTLSNSNALLEQSLNFAREDLNTANAIKDANEGILGSKEKVLAALKQQDKVYRLELEQLVQKSKLIDKNDKQQAENIKKQIEDKKKQIEQQNLSINNQERSIQKEQEMINKGQKIVGLAKEIAGGFQAIASAANTASGGMFPAAELMSFSSILSVLGRQRREAMEANAQFVAATGQSTAMMAGMKGSLGGFGILYKDQVAAFAELQNSMYSFSNLNSSLQGQLANSAARMKNLGVDVSTTGQNYNILTNSLRMNASQAMDVQDKIAKVAIGAGIAPAKMLKEFGSVMPQLAGYGKKAVDVFLDLQKQSKSLGMEIQSLLGIVGEGFDTFEGAAEKAGKLNAILGGNYLNAVDLVNASESERVEILKRSFEMSGKSIDSMGKYGAKAVAGALGIKDLNEVNKLFGKSSSDMAKDMNTQEASQERLIKAQMAAGSVANKLEGSVRKLAEAFQPIADALNYVITGFNKLDNSTKTIIIGTMALAPVLAGIAGTILSVVGALKAMEFASLLTAAATKLAGTSAVTAGTEMAVAGGEALAGGGEMAAGGNLAAGAAPGLQVAGNSARISAGGIAAFGLAAVGIGIGIAIAAYGISLLVESFAGLNKEQIDGATTAILYFGGVIVGLAVILGVLAYSGVLPAAALGMLAFGGAIALMGLGIMFAAAGMSLLVSSFKDLQPTQIIALATGFGMISISLWTLVGALAAFVIASVLGGPALIGLGVAFALMGLGINLATQNLVALVQGEGAEEKLNGLARGITAVTAALAGLSTLGLGGLFGGPLKNISNFVEDTGKALKELPPDMAIKVTAFKEIKELVSVANTTTDDSLKPSTEFVKQVKQLYEVRIQSQKLESDNLLKMLTGAFSSANKENREEMSKNEIPIMVRIEDGEPIKAYVGSSKAGLKT